MAYPSVSGPYGLIPINLIGGQVFAGSTRQMPINSGSGTSIYFGDLVKIRSDGTLDKDTGTSTATPIGVFLGCAYTDPVYGKTFRQSYTANTVASDINAYVVDDPDTLFKVAVCTAGSTTISYVTRSAVGLNTALVQNAGNTITGDSNVAVSSTTATTNTLPIRVVDVIAETVSGAGSYTEVVVKFNQGIHAYYNSTGV